MPAVFNATSLKRLEGVHPHLVAVIKRAAEISDLKFQITEGVRSLARQKELKKAGASQTLRSRHLIAPNGLSHAVDVVVYVSGRISWEFPLYHRLSETIKRAARELGTPIEWGGDWKNLKDGPHFQLPWAQYPGIANAGDAAPQAPTEADQRLLVIGASGATVMDLQRKLNAAQGCNLTVDGNFGSTTLTAVRAFQTAQNLKVDGQVGEKTWAALNHLAR